MNTFQGLFVPMFSSRKHSHCFEAKAATAAGAPGSTRRRPWGRPSLRTASKVHVTQSMPGGGITRSGSAIARSAAEGMHAEMTGGKLHSVDWRSPTTHMPPTRARARCCGAAPLMLKLQARNHKIDMATRECDALAAEIQGGLQCREAGQPTTRACIGSGSGHGLRQRKVATRAAVRMSDLARSPPPFWSAASQYRRSEDQSAGGGGCAHGRKCCGTSHASAS